MTLSESMEMQERILKIANSLEFPTRFQQNYITNALNAWNNSLIRSLSSIDSMSIDTALLMNFANRIVPMYSHIDYDGIISALDAFSHAHISYQHRVSFQLILDQMSETLSRVEPYLPSEEQEKCETIIKPQLKEKTHTRLTLSDALSILSILLSVLFFVLGSMPDNQAERIIQQQDKIIANQEAEIARLREEDQPLLDTLNSLYDSINLLTNEIELLRDELEDSDDLLNSSSQTDPGDPKQQNGDTQD